jgi:hypothetical protein
MPWWLFDMRPQGFLGRAYAQRFAPALGLSRDVREWSDTDGIRALVSHGHDLVGNLLLGDVARDGGSAVIPEKSAETTLSRCHASRI